jgi:cytidine deaminase
MARLARSVAEWEAYSYRNFHVGAAIYAVDPGSAAVGINAAGNLKLNIERQKVCAEKRALRRAVKAELTHAIGFVCVGTTDRDQIEAVSGLRSPTLHLCSDCRIETVGESPLVTDHTLMVTSGIESDITQVHTFGQMTEMYDFDRYTDLAGVGQSNVVPNFNNWSARLRTYDALMYHAPDPTDQMRAHFAQIAITGALRAA